MPLFFRARTATTGSLESYCGVETASRPRARTKASLKRGCTSHSSLMTKRVPNWQPAAPMSSRWAIIRPVPMPPATKMGKSRKLKSTSCSRMVRET